eukprot:CAMPEP_0196721128 /NCGR_PEP_ID=MMETSP1091-20130531/3771_1 /TAXON_ID=302021 /ORGANISM="Rhodomonas sp., Strain CCMP768" /LENGTH=575 /DNA_ID=CAMNT_0042062529 /DNA_START=9 /DNA_END=1736 /DNA_ORIENTATION=+
MRPRQLAIWPMVCVALCVSKCEAFLVQQPSIAGRAPWETGRVTALRIHHDQVMLREGTLTGRRTALPQPTMQVQSDSMQGPNRILRFQAADMEIRRQVGEMGYATVTDWEYYTPRNPLDPEAPSRTYEASGAAVRLFEAKIARGSLMNARVLLKEYFPRAREIAEQELRVYTDLVTAWDDVAPDEDFADAPVATLRGWFQTTEECERASFRENWKNRFPKVAPPGAGNLWLLFRWQGNKAMSEFARSLASPVSFWDQLSAPVFGPRKSNLNTQFYFLRNLVKECLAALTFLHERGVIHRSIGPSSVTMNTFDVIEGDRLQVKLRDFGFASRAALLDDGTLTKAQRAGARTPGELLAFVASEDLYAMGYALAETIFTALAITEEAEAEPQGTKMTPITKQWVKQTQGPDTDDAVSSLGPIGGSQTSGMPSKPAARTDQDALKKLMEDVFESDVKGAFRDYCEAEERWVDVVSFLDLEDRAGWDLLHDMINSKRLAQGDESSYADDSNLDDAGGKSLAELSEDEIADLVPSFAPSTAPQPLQQGTGKAVPSARTLLDNPLVSSLNRPWWAKKSGAAM